MTIGHVAITTYLFHLRLIEFVSGLRLFLSASMGGVMDSVLALSTVDRRAKPKII
jgi:hypothetical protein